MLVYTMCKGGGMSGRVGMSRGICPDPVFLGLYHEGYCPGGCCLTFPRTVAVQGSKCSRKTS